MYAVYVASLVSNAVKDISFSYFWEFIRKRSGYSIKISVVYSSIHVNDVIIGAIMIYKVEVIPDSP